MIAVEDEPDRQCDSVAEIARKPRAIITDRLKTLSRVIRSPRRQASERSGMLGRRGPEQFEFFAGWLRDLIPDDHILARVDRVLDLLRPRGEAAEPYCPDNGRPGVDPEVAVCLTFAGFLLGVVHDRRLMREAKFNLAIRWFAGLASPSWYAANHQQ